MVEYMIERKFDITEVNDPLCNSVTELENHIGCVVSVPQFEEYYKCKVMIDESFITLKFNDEKQYHWFILKYG